MIILTEWYNKRRYIFRLSLLSVIRRGLTIVDQTPQKIEPLQLFLQEFGTIMVPEDWVVQKWLQTKAQIKLIVIIHDCFSKIKVINISTTPKKKNGL